MQSEFRKVQKGLKNEKKRVLEKMYQDEKSQRVSMTAFNKLQKTAQIQLLYRDRNIAYVLASMHENV